MRSAVRIVLQALNLGGDSVLGALEVDDAVVLLVTTTHVAGSDTTVVVTATVAALLFQQGLVRRTFVQILTDNADDVTTTG